MLLFDIRVSDLNMMLIRYREINEIIIGRHRYLEGEAVAVVLDVVPIDLVPNTANYGHIDFVCSDIYCAIMIMM